MNAISHLRGVPALRPPRGHHPAVVVCLDDPTAYDIAPEETVKTVRGLEIPCEECPQSRVDMAPRGAPA